MLGAAGGAAAVESGERASRRVLQVRLLILPHIGLPNSPNGQTHDTLPWPMLADGRKDRRSAIKFTFPFCLFTQFNEALTRLLLEGRSYEPP